MKRVVITSAIVLLAATMAVFVAHPADAAGFNLTISDGADAARGRDQIVDLFGQAGMFRTITNMLLFIVGALSVIMLIIGGLRYVVSGGDSTAVNGAKNTILYAIVGLVVAMLSYAAIAFLLEAFTENGVIG
jgi:hypothetical protein